MLGKGLGALKDRSKYPGALILPYYIGFLPWQDLFFCHFARLCSAVNCTVTSVLTHFLE
jgi:hypothetical protein